MKGVPTTQPYCRLSIHYLRTLHFHVRVCSHRWCLWVGKIAHHCNPLISWHTKISRRLGGIFQRMIKIETEIGASLSRNYWVLHRSEGWLNISAMNPCKSGGS